MQLMTCGVCHHQITGEVKKKKTGKIYIYYRCANLKCPQKRKNVRQEEIFKQLTDALRPFAKFTPKATESLIKSLKGKVDQLGVYSMKAVTKLRDKQKELNKRLKEIDTMREKGVLSNEESGKLLKLREIEIENNEIEIEAHTKADQVTLESAFTIIELLKKASDFMELDGNELQKTRLCKSLLSNLVLKDGTIEFHYKKPFDDLLSLTGGRNWWTDPAIGRTKVTMLISLGFRRIPM